jgi:hypothetical protein
LAPPAAGNSRIQEVAATLTAVLFEFMVKANDAAYPDTAYKESR